MPNRLLLAASENKTLEKVTSSSRLTRPIVQRYVAGTTLDEALTVTEQLNELGIQVSLDLLGESVTDLAESRRATEEYLRAIEQMVTRTKDSTLSVKLSQLGVTLSPAECEANLRRLLEAARQRGSEVEVDMEHSSAGRETFAIVRRIHAEYPETRLAVQACMRSTLQDLADFGGAPLKIRLVKGAFDERPDLAIRNRDDVTAQYRYLARWALQRLPDPAFGTHDDACIDEVKRAAAELGIGKRDFEFQMLHGVRRPLQEQLVREGYRVRVYLPYGEQWYPYLMRRMAEKPANLLLFLRSVVSR
ncbi:proline dehydrogenase family protein [Geodermatophilus sp. SYSU D01176]